MGTHPSAAQAALHDTAHAPKLQALKDLLAECGIGVEPGEQFRRPGLIALISSCETAHLQLCSSTTVRRFMKFHQEVITQPRRSIACRAYC